MIKKAKKHIRYLISTLSKRLEDIHRTHTPTYEVWRKRITFTFLEKCLKGTEFDSRLEQLSFFASSIVFLTERWCSSIRWKRFEKTCKVHNEEYLDISELFFSVAQWLEHSLVRGLVRLGKRDFLFYSLYYHTLC